MTGNEVVLADNQGVASHHAKLLPYVSVKR